MSNEESTTEHDREQLEETMLVLPKIDIGDITMWGTVGMGKSVRKPLGSPLKELEEDMGDITMYNGRLFFN